VLHRYYPSAEVGMEDLSTSSEDEKQRPLSVEPDRLTEKYGEVSLSVPVGAEIEVDRKPKGQIPTLLRLTLGNHLIVVRVSGRPAWMRFVNIAEGERLTLTPSW
jgi:hypothetical protein